MEYYYCPGLLKLLRYLWVSAARRQAGVWVSSSFPSPPAACQVCLLALPASSVSVFFNKWWLFWGGGVSGEGMGTVEERGSPDSLGVQWLESKWPQGGKKKDKTRKTRAALVSFPESDISLL